MKLMSEAIKELTESGIAPKEVAERLGVHRVTVYRAIKKFRLTGSAGRRPGQGRRRSVRTPTLIKAVKGRIKRNPIRSMRQMAKDLKVSERTIRRTIREDLGAKSRARTTKHLISADAKVKRLERCRLLRNRLKKGKQVILFSDEKLFNVDAMANSRNNRYISSEDPKDVPENIRHSFRTKHPASVMVFGMVSSDGKKMSPVFIDSGVRIDTKEYIRILEANVKPWVASNYGPKTKIVFQQDGAPAHTSKKTQEWLKKAFPNFWSKGLWPPNSPDLNPMDYSIWGLMETKACSKPHPNISSLRISIAKAWANMSADYIRATCNQFRARIEAVIKNKGGHFE